MAVVVGTWSFSDRAVRVIADELMRGKASLDALEMGINEVEEDPLTGPYVVGRGGYPNAEGVLECDAGVMLGDRCQVGAVAGLRGVATPFSVARLVLERSPHNMLVGSGAQQFANENGVKIENEETLQTSQSREAFKAFKDKGNSVTEGHDTLGIIVLDDKGHLLTGVSSSGKPFKSPGRVGDSPLPGSGLYADDEVGAAVASGDGDMMMCFCPSFHAVQLMKQGCSPQEACDQVVVESQRKAGRTLDPFEMALIAMNKKGEVGVATTVSSWKTLDGQYYTGFPYVIWTQHNDKLEIRVQRPIEN